MKGFSNQAVLKVLLEGPYAHFRKVGNDDWRDTSEKNPGFSLSTKGFFDHEEECSGHLSKLAYQAGIDVSALDHRPPSQEKFIFEDKHEFSTSDKAEFLWNRALSEDEAMPFAKQYFSETRCIPPSHYIDLIDLDVIRYLPESPPYPPQLIVRFDCVDENLTWRESVRKILMLSKSVPLTNAKKLLGREGNLIALPPLNDQNSNKILVLEGFVNALTLRGDFEEFSILVTAGKGNFSVVKKILNPGCEVLIISDHDNTERLEQSGQFAAAQLLEALHHKGVECKALMPPKPGWDANDAQCEGTLRKWISSLVEVTEFLRKENGFAFQDEQHHVHSDADWEVPEELATSSNVEPYPIDLLPNEIKLPIQEVAEFVQAPVSLVAASALSTISAVVQGFYDVRRVDGLQGPSGLFMLSIADSGERKSSSNKFTKILLQHQNKSRVQNLPQLEEFRAKKKVFDAKQSGLIQKIRDRQFAGKQTDDAENELIRLGFTEPVPPRIPRWLYQDTSIESLLEKLTEWPVGVLESDEAGSFFGGYSARESSMKLLSDLNRLWDAEPQHIDRKHSKSFVVQGARLSLALMVQESTLRNYISRSKGLFRGTGFLSRCLITWPTSRIGTRPFKSPPKSWPNLTAFNHRITQLLEKKLPINDQGHLEPEVLEFSPQAQDWWIRFHDELERELSIGKELHDVRDLASKTPENAARLAAIIHAFAGDGSPQISASHFDAAKGVALWHLYEAQRFMRKVDSPSAISDAQLLERWMLMMCKEKQQDRIPRRIVQRYGPLRDGKLLTEALSVLEDHDRCRLVILQRKKIILINPLLLKE